MWTWIFNFCKLICSHWCTAYFLVNFSCWVGRRHEQFSCSKLVNFLRYTMANKAVQGFFTLPFAGMWEEINMFRGYWLSYEGKKMYARETTFWRLAGHSLLMYEELFCCSDDIVTVHTDCVRAWSCVDLHKKLLGWIT